MINGHSNISESSKEKVLSVIAIGQTIVLLLIGIGGVVVCFLAPEKITKFTPFLSSGWGKVLVVMGFSLIGFEGYEVISNAAEEVIDAKKNIPKAIFYSVMIVITTYLLVAFAAIIGSGQINGSITDWFSSLGAIGFAEAIGRLFPFGGLSGCSCSYFRKHFGTECNNLCFYKGIFCFRKRWTPSFDFWTYI